MEGSLRVANRYQEQDLVHIKSSEKWAVNEREGYTEGDRVLEVSGCVSESRCMQRLMLYPHKRIVEAHCASWIGELVTMLPCHSPAAS